MSDTIKITGLNEGLKFISALPAHTASSAKQIFADTAMSVQKQMTQRSMSGPLHSRSGELGRSWRFSTFGTSLGDIGSSTYTSSPYALIHETGGTIRAKRAYSRLPGGPYLNIPSEANKTPAGVMRRSARDVFAAGGYIVPIKNAGKARFAVIEGGKAMFWLVKEVTLPARLGFEETATREIPTLLSRLKGLKFE
ncbi:hypothetical protein [Pseudomonas monteilii]|uniref:hypothetical protein n=1 Tax=Pseudomonas monteilii TaxID=76759 RepID=UPI001F18D802|nr:hypothetical protein [Pseudomonas monteilii]